MSLDELLKESDDSSAWKNQRKKLIRLAAGLGAVAAGLVIATIAIMAAKKHRVRVDVSSAQAQEEQQNAKALAQLMRVQNDAAALREDLERTRAERPARAGTGGRARGADRQIINYDPGEGFAALEKQKSDVYLPTGTVFQGQLITPIKTSVDRTFVMAETTNEYRMDMKRKIPKGSRLIGRSRLNPVLKGVIVEFDKLVLPNGIETNISAMALSRNALPEIDGLYFSNRAVTYGTALAFGFLSGFSAAARDREVTVLGSQPEVSVGNQALTGLSTASFQVANEMLRDIQKNSVEYVVVPAGEQVFVALTRRYDIDQGGPK